MKNGYPLASTVDTNSTLSLVKLVEMSFQKELIPEF